MGKKILIADPRDVIRAGLHAILEQDERVSDIYEATTTDDLRKEQTSHSLDLVIIHQSLITEIKLLPKNKFVLIVNQPDIQVLLDAYRHQACGYFSENITSDLLRGILQMEKGTCLLDPALFPWIMEYILGNMQWTSELNSLTAREREIYLLLQDGHPRQLIARQLHISEATLKTHIKNISRKRLEPNKAG